MAEARESVGLRHRLHRLSLPNAALHEAAFLLIEIDGFRQRHFGALGNALSTGIFPETHPSERELGRFSRV